jgi:hypothetical protein
MRATLPHRRIAGTVSALLLGLALAVGCGASGQSASGEGAAGIDLRGAPWASQPGGSPTIDVVTAWPSLRFPAGVSYEEALRRLFLSARQGGQPPPEAIVMEPLPSEVVMVRPADRTTGLRVSLTAPWGWTLDGRAIRPPSVGLPAGLAPGEAQRRFAAFARGETVLPEGGWVDAPDLPGCQVADGAPDRREPCP